MRSKLKMLLFIFALFFYQFGLSTETESDSLKKKNLYQSDTTQVNLLFLKWDNLIFNFPDSAITIAQEAYRISEEIAYKKGMGLALNKIGYGYERKSDAREALSYQWRALAILEEIGDNENIAWCWHNIGNAYSLRGEYEEALKNHYKALKLREEISHKRGIAYSYSAIAVIYQRQGNFSEELLYQQKSLAIMQEIGDKEGLARTYSSLGASYNKHGDSEKAELYLNNAIAMLENASNKMNLIYALTSAGEFYLGQKKYDKALEIYFRMQEVSMKIGNKFVIAGSLKRIGDVYQKSGDQKHALEYANQSLALAEKINAKVQIRDVSKILSAIYESKGDYKQAMFYYTRYATLKDSISSVETQSNISKLQNQYQSEKKDKEIEILKREQQNNYLIRNSIIAISFLILIIAVLAIRGNRLKQKQNNDLQRLNTLLEIEQKKSEDANLVKSKLLSIVAHDLKNPLQSVVGFALLIEEKIRNQSAKISEVHGTVLKMADAINRSSLRMTKLIDNLLKSSQIESGKIELQKSSVDINDLVKQVIDANAALSDMKHLQLFFETCTETLFAYVDEERIHEVLENLIGNAIKFSPIGKSIWIELLESDSSIRLSVKDQGQGFSVDDMKKVFGKFQRLSSRPTGGETTTGLGLSIAKDFVELHGGKIWVESDGKDLGSKFIVELPKGEMIEVEARMTINS